MRILLLEDDVDLRRSIRKFLRADGFSVDEAGDLHEADERLSINTYDALVLDRNVPSGDSITLLADRRRAGLATPALFLTARDAVNERVEGLQAGADDYLVKPFAMEELMARVHSLCRRSIQVAPPTLQLGDLTIDTARRSVTRAGEAVELTAKELALLEYLVAHTGTVMSRSELIEHCWDEYADPMSNVVDVRIRQVRLKLGEPAVIHTVRGGGYVAELR